MMRRGEYAIGTRARWLGPAAGQMLMLCSSFGIRSYLSGRSHSLWWWQLTSCLVLAVPRGRQDAVGGTCSQSL